MSLEQPGVVRRQEPDEVEYMMAAAAIRTD